jgi:4-hydroxy 2-oxovalerate aldolase
MIADNYAKVPNPYTGLHAAQLLDVTLRDGGFTVDFDWSADTVEAVVGSIAAAGIPFVEIGYHGGIPEMHGVPNVGISANVPLARCRALKARSAATELVLMVHPGCVTDLDFDALAGAGVGMVRFVYHPSWRSSLSRLVRGCLATGIQTAVNIALLSRYRHADIVRVAEEVAAFRPSVLYLADTCSSLYPEQVGEIVGNVKARLPEVPIGFHGHDFLTLAFANAIAAVRAGATFVDVSLLGIGRGAGNLRTELWCAATSAQGVSSFDLAALIPGLDAIDRARRSTRAYDLPSLVAGACNLTPPQEDCLRTVARDQVVDANVLAARFLGAYEGMSRIDADAVHDICVSEVNQ